MRHTSWKPGEAAIEDARRVLPELVRAYFAAGRKLTEKSGPKALHRFRLKTKRLRYTLDAFETIYGHGLKRRSGSLKTIQTSLGDANDCAVLLRESGSELPEKVRAWLVERADQSRQEFLKFWKDEFDATGEEKKWEKYLTHSTIRTAARKTPTVTT